MKVLIVGEDKDISFHVAEAATRLGFEPEFAPDDPEAAFEMAAAPGREHVVFSSGRLYGRDGARLLEAVRRGNPATPVIVLTGCPYTEFAVRRLGGHVVAKPCSIEAIYDALALYARRRP